MIKIAITGGIGSGKSSVCRYAEQLGIPVYYSDIEAKRLMVTTLKPKVIELFGEDSYIDGQINKPKFNKLLFSDKKALELMNSITVPEINKDIVIWASKQKSNIVIVESALIFDHHQEDKYDYIINVTADLDTRIKRVANRDNISEDIIRNKIKNQLSDEYRNEHSDFVIHNDKDISYMQKQFDSIIEKVKSENLYIKEKTNTMEISKFSDYKKGKQTFYKIIDNDKKDIDKWLNKDFIKGKNTIVTKNPNDSWVKAAEVTDRSIKTVVKLNVPENCILDNEGNWFILDLDRCSKNDIDVSLFK